MITGFFGVRGAKTRLVPEALKGDGAWGQLLLDTLNVSVESSGRDCPIMEYAASVWDPHQQYLIDNIEGGQPLRWDLAI